MRKFYLLATVLLSAFQAPIALAADEIASQCVADLEPIPSFLLENDPGASMHLAQHGQEQMDRAYREAETRARRAASDQDCVELLKDYVHHWRSDHLSVASTDSEQPAAQQALPPAAIQTLSEHTLLISIPSFKPRIDKRLWSS